jgi:hypothetical protein
VQEKSPKTTLSAHGESQSSLSPARLITRLQRDDPRTLARVEKGRFDEALDGLAANDEDL